MTEDEHRQEINVGLMQMVINALTKNLAQVSAELDMAKARVAKLEKPAIRPRRTSL